MNPGTAVPALTLRDTLGTWVRIALLSFGGPAGQIAVMHRVLVEEKRWIGEQRFLHALNFCMLLPGPEAQQLVTYVGWLLHGVRGGLLAGTLFVLPGFVAIMALSLAYVTWGYSPWVAGLLLGLKAAVVALILQALIRIAGRALKDSVARVIALTAFIGIWLLQAPFPVIVVAAGVVGMVLGRLRRWQPAAAGHGKPAAEAPAPVVPESALTQGSTSAGRALRVLAVSLALWFLPIAALAAWAGPRATLTNIAVFFSKMAVVTFGGAYAVLAYVAQQAVDHFHWVTPAQMLDGLGFAESTPGPLIMVVQFVGFMGAYQDTAAAHPVLAGVLAACVTVWVTFVPCFLWIFLGAPYIERLRSSVVLGAGLAAITAAVVGVIANLALWFTVHALFASQRAVSLGRWLQPLELPVLDSVRWDLAALIALGLVVTFGLRWGLARLMAVCLAAGILATLMERAAALP